MAVKWTYFVGASLIAAILLLRGGAPWPTILAGIAIAGLWNFYRSRSRAH